jgi:hypothetical protein
MNRSVVHVLVRSVASLFVILFLAMSVACSTAQRPTLPIALDSVRAPIVGITTESRIVDKATYELSLQKLQEGDAVRIVEIFQNTAAIQRGAKEFRLFDVYPGSPYDLLGLRSADVLVSAQGYIIQSPRAFINYLVAVPYEKGGSFIEIRRAGKPIKLAIAFSGGAS